MRSVLLVLLLSTGLALSSTNSASSLAQDAPRDPDRLYEDRAQLASGLEAAAIWEQRLTRDGRDFEAGWKLARACYWLGSHVLADARRKQYERGIAAATRAAAINSRRPEGHFWMAANMGAMAESFGLRAGLRYRGAVKRELETALALDPSYEDGAADRALGRWYLRVPGWLGGSKKASVEHLQRSLTYDPGSAASHFFLAETFVAMDRTEDARRELQEVLDAPFHPDWVPEVNEFKQKARALLEKLRRP